MKRPEDLWFAIGFSLVKRSDLRFVVPRSAVWSGGLAFFCSSVWLSSISSVGGLFSLEAHSRFVWLSPCKFLVVLSFMDPISFFLSHELSVTWSFQF